MSEVLFVDTETTGLDPDRHEIWEVALVDAKDVYQVWQLPVDLGRADPRALAINGYYERAGTERLVSLPQFAEEFEVLTRGAHLAGSVVSFDEERLRRLLQWHGACPGWHYHLIDVEAMAVGYLHGRGPEPWLNLPWDSEELSRAVGVDPFPFDRHTALGDARWAKAIYDTVISK